VRVCIYIYIYIYHAMVRTLVCFSEQTIKLMSMLQPRVVPVVSFENIIYLNYSSNHSLILFENRCCCIHLKWFLFVHHLTEFLLSDALQILKHFSPNFGMDKFM
jgi:hypothetical protein